MTDEIARSELARLSQIRTQLLAEHPFWGHLLLQVALVSAPELPAFAATDCLHHIWFNPLQTQHLSIEQLGFVVAHELGHQIFLSRDRSGDRDPHRWNCATDYAINRIVASIPHPTRPDTPLYPPPQGEIPGLGDVQILLDPRFDGKIAEAIYTLLDDDGLPEPSAVDLTLPLPATGIDLRPPGCASHGGGIDIHLPTSLSPAEHRALAERVGEALARAHSTPGDTAGNRIRQVRPEASQVDWRLRLHAHLAPFCGAPDQFDRSRPHRRWLARGEVRPALRGERLGRIVAAVDTSGSMRNRDLARVLGELRALAPLTQELTVLVADARVHEVLEVDEALDRLDQGGWTRGGGTDHRPEFHWIDRSGLVPDVFVGLTDLFTRLPNRPPEYPVLWVLPAKHGEVPWGTAIALPDLAPSPPPSTLRRRPPRVRLRGDPR